MSYRYPDFQNVITVAKDGSADWPTIEAGIAASSAGDTILVYGGTYAENNPLNQKTDTTINCLGRHQTTIMTCNNPGSHGIIHASGNQVIGLEVRGATGAGKSGFYVPAGVENVEWDDCQYQDCDNGWLSETNTVSPNIHCYKPNVERGTTTSVFKTSAGGLMNVISAFVSDPVIAAQVFHVDGVGSTIRVVSSRVNGANTACGALAENGGLAVVTASHLRDVTTGFCTEPTGGTIRGIGSTIESPAIAVRCGANGKIDCDAVRISDSTIDLQTDAASSEITWTGGEVNTRKNSKFPGSTIIATYLEGDAGDRGNTTLGEHHVIGESTLGEGDSTTLDMVVFRRSSVGVWDDITAALVAGTAQDLFADNLVSSDCFIGNTGRKFPGWKDIVSIAASLGAGAIEVSLSVGASAFTPIGVMSTDSEDPFLAHAQEIFERIQGDQVFLNPSAATWIVDTIGAAPVTPTIAWWIRLRIITGALATVPTLANADGASLKLHVNSFEVERCGFTSFRGLSRRPLDIPFKRLADTSAVPVSATIEPSVNISYDEPEASFTNSKVDATVFVINIPAGVDTSFPATVEVKILPRTPGGGVNTQIELETDETIYSNGDTLNGTAADTAQSNIITGLSTPASDDDLLVVTFDFDISVAVPGDTLTVRVFRDATAGNLDDNWEGDVDLAVERVTCMFWHV